jgi:hypothetical protein
MGRERIGSLTTAEDFEAFLQKWLNGYCNSSTRALSDEQARYPLREGLVRVGSFDPASLDTTGGFLEHNDPRHQLWFRSFSDLPGNVSFDLTLRRVSALPKPVVPGHTELTLHVARPVGASLLLEVVGDNLLHAREIELVQLGPPHAVPRSAFVRLTWETR